ncbi:regulator [Pantoea sp.]|uniref:regulator n=1 Tax=Pantoea sp. TaxID=69393 RepID=UPI00289CCF81|nr:regulator [Pantoea sp.]
MNSKQRYNAKRAAEHRAKKAAERQFENGIVTTLMGCSLNVARATSAPSLREKREEVALRISTKYQKVSNEAGRQIHAVQKVRGKSMPPRGIL